MYLARALLLPSRLHILRCNLGAVIPDHEPASAGFSFELFGVLRFMGHHSGLHFMYLG